MRRLLPFVVALICLSVASQRGFGQSTGDYRTSQDGSWNDVGIWERFSSGSWQPAIATPTDVDGAISIEHDVNIPNGFTVSADQLSVIDQLTVDAGGQLNLEEGPVIDLTVPNAASRVIVDGTFVRVNISTIDNSSDASRILFQAGSTYRHQYSTTVGTLPIATWDATSTIIIEGFINPTNINANVTWAQTVGNVIYNCPGQVGMVNFAGNLTDIQGDLTIMSTGSNVMQLINGENVSVTIGGNVSISGTSRVNFSNSSAGASYTVNGNFNYTSTHTGGSNITLTGTCTVGILGNFFMNSSNGRIHLGNAGSTGTSTINFSGDFTLQSGRIDEIGAEPTQGTLRFISNGTQNFTRTGGVITGHINYYISPNTTLNVGASLITGSSPSAFTLEGTIIVGSLDTLGSIQTSTGRGNIRTPNAFRTYASGSTIVYGGAGLQYIGNGQPSSAGITTIIDNVSDVRLSRNTTIDGHLRIESGDLDLNNFILTSGGTFESVGGFFLGTANSSLVISGAAVDWGTIAFHPAANTLGTLTIDRSNNGASASLNSALVISSALNLTRGVLNNISGLSLLDGGVITRYENSVLTGERPTISTGSYDLLYRTSQIAGGPYNYSTGPELPDPANTTNLGNITINTAQAQDVINLVQNVTINGDVLLTRGIFALNSFTATMQGSTWSDNAGTLDSGTGTVVFNGTTTVGGSSDPLFGNIQLNTLSSLTFSRNVNITGNIDFASGSTFDMGNLVVTLSGSNQQTISVNGTNFSNITVAKSGQGIQLTSSMGLTGILRFNSPSSNVNFVSNGNLVLVSTTDSPGAGTGMIYRLVNGNTVSGDVIAQRYMSGEGKIFRYISSPVSNANVDQWQDDFPITGNFLDPSPAQQICGSNVNPASPSLYYYDETVTGDINQGWTAYPPPGASATTTPIVVGRGYSAFIRECTNPTIIDITGPVNQGNISLPVTYTVSDPAADGWNLVGNPMPSMIDWDAVSRARVSSIIAIKDDPSGMLRYYDAGVANDIPGGEIALGQAFYVLATAGNPIVIVREASKGTNVPEFFREGEQFSLPSFVLSLSQGDLWDKAYVKITSEASSAFDAFDAPKLSHDAFSIATLSSDNVPMAINSYGEFSCQAEIGIALNNLEAGTYSFKLETRQEFEYYKFTLIDKFTGELITLNDESFEFSVTDNAQSKASDRFLLRVEEKLPDVNLSATVPATVCNETSDVVTLNSSEPGVTYSLWLEDQNISGEVEGNGQAVSLDLSADKLKMGDNTVMIMAKRLCASVPFESVYTVRKESAVVENVYSSTACQSGSATLSASSNLDGGVYSWYESQDASIPVYIGEQFITPELVKPQTYYVSVSTLDNGCTSARVAVQADVRLYDPAQISVSGSGKELISNYEEGNTWWLNGVAINEATGKTIGLTLSGVYELRISVNGCETIDTYEHTIAATETMDRGLVVYPNPFKDKITVNVHDESIRAIEFVSMLGQQVGSFTPGHDFSTLEIDFNAQPDGVYFMIVNREDERRIYRIVKQAK